MSFSSWLLNWMRSLDRRSALRQIPRPRPSAYSLARQLFLEALEDRTLLSTFVVANTGDNGGVNPAPGAGTGTLRQAIIDADAANTGTAANPDLIQFNIPTTDPGYNSTTKQFTIQPISVLPTIREPVLLDGYSQPGASPNTNPMGGADPSDNAIRLIVLDGTQVTDVAQGNYDVGLLSITGANSTIRGLVVQYPDIPISIFGSGATGNVIEGNYLEAEGNNIAGRLYGIMIEGASNNTIGGTDPSARNILDSSNPLLFSSGAGGQIAIFGTPGFGAAKNNIVEGNYIGLNAQGSIVATASTGIFLDGAEYTQIGGANAAERNVISGWNWDVFMGDNSDPDTNFGNRIEGNYIGTDASGAAAVAAGTVFTNGGQVGLTDSTGSNNLISGNLISGNSGLGLAINSCSGDQIQNNLIGTDASGSNPLPNGEGVVIGSLINGSIISGNTIAYNNGPGVDVFGPGAGGDFSAAGDQIKGNSIYANAGPGVWVEADPFGSADPFGAFTDGDGPHFRLLSTGISIQGNSIYGNGGLGIALGSIAVDANGNPLTLQQVEDNLQTNPDLWDHDEPNKTVILNDMLGHQGANDLQNFPVLNSATGSSADTLIAGAFSEADEPNTTLTLDFYANPTADPSGYGQGQIWLGSTTDTTDSNGTVVFTADLDTSKWGNLVGQWITVTATVTDPNSSYNGDTSEFALDVQATATSSQAFSDWLKAALPQSTSDTAEIALQSGPGLTEDTAISAVNALSAPSVATTITLDLDGGTYDDTSVSPPQNVTLIIDGSNGTNTFVGHSPAFIVTGGKVIVRNVTFTTATDAPTILVTGGSLTLRNDVVQESTGYSDDAIEVTGGTVDLGTATDPGGNTININGAGAFANNTTSTPIAAVGDTFTVNGLPLTPSTLSGTVFEDFNDDGQIDFGEEGIANVLITLTGTDDLGNAVSQSQLTDADGAYVFLNLRPGNYTITETQPSGYAQGIDSVGTAGGTLSATDQFSINLAPEVNGLNYNFGEQPAGTGPVTKGQTAGIGFWNNKNGQALILAFNGGTGTQLADWLAATLPNMFGTNAGSNDLAGKSNAYVAALFQSDFVVKGVKLDAQVLATALSVYATNATLDNTDVAANYGFIVSGDGLGTATVNVGSNGAAFGVGDNTVLTVLDLLKATDAQAVGGLLYNGDAILRKEANNVYSAINEEGDIG